MAAIVFLISVSDIVLRPGQSAPSAKDRTVDTIATDLVLDLKVERLVQKHRVDLNRSLTGPLSPWQIASAWVTAREIIPDFAPRLGKLFQFFFLLSFFPFLLLVVVVVLVLSCLVVEEARDIRFVCL